MLSVIFYDSGILYIRVFFHQTFAPMNTKFKSSIGNRGLKSGGGKRENETIMIMIIIDIPEKLDGNFEKDTICSVPVSLSSSYRIRYLV